MLQKRERGGQVHKTALKSQNFLFAIKRVRKFSESRKVSGFNSPKIKKIGVLKQSVEFFAELKRGVNKNFLTGKGGSCFVGGDIRCLAFRRGGTPPSPPPVPMCDPPPCMCARVCACAWSRSRSWIKFQFPLSPSDSEFAECFPSLLDWPKRGEESKSLFSGL